MIRTFVFDFDGTLVDSNSIKHRAYFDIFAQHPRLTPCIQEVIADGGLKSRVECISTIYQKGLDSHLFDFSPKTCDAYVNDYSTAVLEQVKQAQPTPESEDVLSQLHQKNIPLYLSSLTPNAPLLEIIADRNWRHFFKKIYGYPQNKADTLKAIIQEENCLPHEIMVVGDGESDRLSAEQTNATFFHVNDAEGLGRLIAHCPQLLD